MALCQSYKTGAAGCLVENFSANMLALAGDWTPVSATPNKLASGARAEEALLSGHRAALEILSGLAK